MKRMLRIRRTTTFLVSIFILMLFSFPVNAGETPRTFLHNDGVVSFVYTLKNGNATILGIASKQNNQKVITFPRRVLNPYTRDLGYPVTEIRYELADYTNFETNTGGGFTIGKVQVVLPEGYLVVGEGAFRGDEMAGIRLPDSLVEIGKFAFEGSAITELNIPAGVSRIGDAAFANCKKLRKVTLSPDNGHYQLMENFIVERASMRAIAYFGSGGKVQVPEGVKEIAPYALDNGKKITQLSLPASLEQLKD